MTVGQRWIAPLFLVLAGGCIVGAITTDPGEPGRSIVLVAAALCFGLMALIAADASEGP